jgi:hypothetical protein
MRIVEFLLNLLGWLQITISASLIGFVIGLAVYYFDNITGLWVGTILTSICFVIGAVCATKIWKKHGTVDWLSRIRRIE